MKRTRIPFAFAILALATSIMAASKPNIVLIMADDLGYETIGANGSTCKTPNIDKLAANGIRFEHCYSQPLCTPSRVKIMTGISNIRNYVKFGMLDRKQTTFAHLFKKAGYTTCIGGKWQLGKQVDSPKHFGFDESCLWQHTRGRTKKGGFDSRYPNPQLEINGKPVDYSNGEYGPDVVAGFLCDFIKRNKNNPFLLYYPMILTHCPFNPPPDTPDWDPKSPGPKSYKGEAKYYPAMVAHMDKMVGRIVAQLEECGLRDNTLVIFTGDNGTDKPVVTEMKDGSKIAGGKGSMTNAGNHVPLVVNWPGKVVKGKVSQDLIDHSDFFPTICEAAGITVPDELGIDGRSFFPQLKGEAGSPRKWIYMWYSPSGQAGKAKIFARNQRYKLYSTGKYYDISKDVLEKNDLGQNGPPEIRDMLQKVLDKYKDARPPELLKAGAGKKGKKKKKKKK